MIILIIIIIIILLIIIIIIIIILITIIIIIIIIITIITIRKIRRITLQIGYFNSEDPRHHWNKIQNHSQILPHSVHQFLLSNSLWSFGRQSENFLCVQTYKTCSHHEQHPCWG